MISDGNDMRIDVTQTEEALRDSQERLRLIVENAHDYAIFITDPDNRITDWFLGAAKVFGWRAEEAMGQKADILFTAEDRQAGVPEAEFATAMRDGVAPDVRWHLCKDGSLVFIEGSVTRLNHRDGQLRGFVKIGQDVTARKQAEDRLKESEERFRQFGEASLDVLWIRNAESLAFEYASPAFNEIYGVDVDEILAGNDVKLWAKLILPQDRGGALAAVARVRSGERQTHEYRIRRPSDGQIRWLKNTDFPLLDDRGMVQRIGGITEDITEEKETSDRLEVLVGELQHRTRNLLGVVRAIVQRTVNRSASLEEFEAHFNDRLAALARANGLLSRLEEGHKVTFGELIRTELRSLGALEGAAAASSVVLSGPEDVRLRSSTVQTLALALHELGTNSVKYGALSPPGGRLAIRWRVEEQESGSSMLNVEWSETGVARRSDGTPARGNGYGRELIERALPYQLGATTQFELRDDGVRCAIVLPLADIPVLETNNG